MKTMKFSLTACLAAALFQLAALIAPCRAAVPPPDSGLPRLEKASLDVIFSGTERLRYAVSWSGGVKIGDVQLEIRPGEDNAGFLMEATVKSLGPLQLFYPVNDTFRCTVAGPWKLPRRYEVRQIEGYGRDITRLTLYDQETRQVRYRKNQGDWEEFDAEGQVYNEITAFVITRALRNGVGMSALVPAFADKKRHEVKVECAKKERKNTIFGDKNTLKIQPRLDFKGIYDKEGDTVLWLTDDRCRIPVEIQAKIAVGSLVAELVDYANTACPEAVILPGEQR